MQTVTIAGTSISVSRLAFGTASLHHLATRRARLRLLATALDAGFTHFDTSPYYGSGLAESALGELPEDRRQRITVTTKVGLYAPGGRARSALSVWARRAAGRVRPVWSRGVANWNIARAKLSLDESLKALRRDSVDFLLLHEPRADGVADDEFLDWLQIERADGRIRAWGVAGELAGFMHWIAAGHPIAAVVQTRDSVDGRPTAALRTSGRPLQFTFGYLSAARPDRPASSTLRAALARNASACVIVSTRRIERIAELAAAA